MPSHLLVSDLPLHSSAPVWARAVGARAAAEPAALPNFSGHSAPKIISLRHTHKVSLPLFQFASPLTPCCQHSRAGSRGSLAVPAVPSALSAPSPYLLLRAGPRSPPGIQVVQRRVRSDKILTAFGIHLWRMTLVPQKSLWCTGNS